MVDLKAKINFFLVGGREQSNVCGMQYKDKLCQLMCLRLTQVGASGGSSVVPGTYFSERGQGNYALVHPSPSMDPLPLGIHIEYLCGLRWHLVSCLRMPQIIEKWILDCSAAVHLLCSQ